MTDDELPKRLKNPRSAARPSLRSRAYPERDKRHTGLGAGPADLGHLSRRKTALLAFHGLDKRLPAYIETKRLIDAIEGDLGGHGRYRLLRGRSCSTRPSPAP
jgi:hypothetical protein